MAAGSEMSRRDYRQWRDRRAWVPPAAPALSSRADLAPAEWIEPQLVPGSFQVQMTVPGVFEAYARVFFPFPGADIVADGEVVGQELITWTEMPRRNGRTAHALMEAETSLAARMVMNTPQPASARWRRRNSMRCCPSWPGTSRPRTAGFCSGTALET